ncbi:MAG: undecaprenyl/decaprenyl-phosphate alpha-N-acetylglucosaminyl 1-phosphate transferase [bacterium]|jgi:UDP-GlcNAc:undecaprenyl-phosphate GlcNAc-1-phosphate transferase|nr:undecaprenyl/decaprenyl-phosphate alpha-N-acetylglucosaminyl 1-phosphate transferase [bacterium]
MPSSDPSFAPFLSVLQSFDPAIGPVLDNLGPAVPPFLVALVLGGVLSVAAIPASHLTGMLKVPRADRDIHRRPVPLLGGAVLYCAFAISALALAPATLERNVLIGLGAIVTALFLVDDRFQLPAWLKLIFQTLPALAAVIAFGWTFQITYLTLPVVGLVHTGWLAAPLSVLWLLGMENTVNLLDGLDGLAAGVVAIVALTLMIAAASIGQHQVVLLAAGLAGACGGFLLLNFHPARIFMGDSGAHFLGFSLGLLSIMGVAKVAVVFALAVPMLALGVPIADTAWSIVRRQRQGVSFAHADARHLHHRLLESGLTQRETCLVFYGAAGILGAVGLTVFGHRKILLVAIVLMVVVLSTALAERLQQVRRSLGPALLRAVLRSRAAP